MNTMGAFNTTTSFTTAELKPTPTALDDRPPPKRSHQGDNLTDSRCVPKLLMNEENDDVLLRKSGNASSVANIVGIRYAACRVLAVSAVGAYPLCRSSQRDNRYARDHH